MITSNFDFEYAELWLRPYLKKFYFSKKIVTIVTAV